MSYEYAACFRLLLLCGYTQELERYVDAALEEEDPLSPIILALSTTGGDDRKKLSILNEFLLDVKESEIDYDQTVFALVMDFLRDRAAEGMPTKELCHLMYRLALSSERYFDEPWHTMYYMEDLHDEAEMDIYVSKEDFQLKFHAFFSDGICLSAYHSPPEKDSVFTRIRKLFRPERK